MVASADAKLVAIVDANTKSMENALKRLEVLSAGSFERQAKSAQKLDSTLAGIGKQATTLGTQLTAAGKSFALAFGAGLGIGGLASLPSMIAKVSKSIADMADQADRIGITTDSLQELRYAANQAGVDVGELDSGMEKFAKTLSEAQRGQGELNKLFRANGMDQAAIKALTFEQALGKVADLMKNAKNAQDALNISSMAFGRGAGAALVNFGRQGAAGIEAARKEAHDFNQVISKDLVPSQRELDDAIERFKGSLQTTFMSLVVEATGTSGSFADALDRLSKSMSGFVEATQSSGDPITDFSTNIAKLTEALRAYIGLPKNLGPSTILPNLFPAPKRPPVNMPSFPGKQIDDIVVDQWKDIIGKMIYAIDPMGKAADGAADPITKMAEAASKAASTIDSSYKAIAAQIGKSATDAASFLRQEEGFIGGAKYDVNHYRVGYGSDTQTDAMGRVTSVTAGSQSTRADAERDLARRISLIQMELIKIIGDEVFKNLNSGAIAAITSIGYQYGTGGQAFKSVANAAKGGNAVDISSAIGALATPTPERRARTQELALTGAPEGDATLKALQAQNALLADQKQKLVDLAATKEELIAASNRETEAMNLEAKSFGMSSYEAEKQKSFQDLLNQSIEAGIPITDDYRKQLEGLAANHAAAATATETARTASESLQESQQNQIAQMDELRSFSSGVLSGFISDLVHGKSASEALAGALGKIADKLIDMASNNIIAALFGKTGTAGGGIFGSLFGGAAAIPTLSPAALALPTGGGLFAQGGIMTSRGPVPLKRYASGGVASSPQMAMFGEGSSPEAYVPLPDGRRIPVALRAPHMSGPPGSRQRVDVDSRIHVVPSDQFDVRVESRVRQAQAETFRTMPGYLADTHARAAGTAR